MKVLKCVNHSRLWKILQETGISEQLTCLLKNLYTSFFFFFCFVFSISVFLFLPSPPLPRIMIKKSKASVLSFFSVNSLIGITLYLPTDLSSLSWRPKETSEHFVHSFVSWYSQLIFLFGVEMEQMLIEAKVSFDQLLIRNQVHELAWLIPFVNTLVYFLSKL